MKKYIVSTIFIVFVLIFYGVAFASDTHSEQAAQEPGKAAFHAIIETGQVVSAASTVPLGISGSVPQNRQIFSKI